MTRKKDIISQQLETDLIKLVHNFKLAVADIFDIGSLDDLKISLHYNSKMSPRSSAKVTMYKSDEFFVESGKVIRDDK